MPIDTGNTQVSLSSEDQWRWGDVKETDITPSWVGGDGIFTEGVDANDDPVLRRVFTKESRPYASPFNVIAAMMKAAGEISVAPEVVTVADETIVMRRMPEHWRNAKLDELRDPYILWAVLEQHRRVHEITVDKVLSMSHRSILDDVSSMRDRCVASSVPLPHGIDHILKDLEPFIARVDGLREPCVPCHGDGAASNVLIDTQTEQDAPNAPLLTGWTVSGVMDPLEEAGSVLSEVGQFCGNQSSLVTGLGLDAECLRPAQAFSIINDVYWSLIGLWRSATSENAAVDFAKYGLWRLVKARNQLCTPIGPGKWLKEL
ncbi:MAG: hypothetical protein ABF747_05710 [Bifidobacterium sp.]|uniref:Aminoglycoside phosphotransferase domain-containing protein n=1 Tax=Bifidobacterium fermentum TaxID=3059035 RepID=A0AB39UBK0_9BIFI